MNINEKAARRVLRNAVSDLSCAEGGQVEQLNQKVAALERCVEQFATLLGLNVEAIKRFEDEDDDDE